MKKSRFYFYLIFGFSLFYWLYLAFYSRMNVTMDAAVFHDMGASIYHLGWIPYFETGPNKEPLYPFLISLSMRMAETLSISYMIILKIIQILCLFATQVLLYQILNKLSVSPKISAAVLIYLAISPAIVNSALSLFSEILTYPLILAIVWYAAALWQSIPKEKPFKAVSQSIFFSLTFILIISVKSIFQYVFLFTLLPFLILTVSGLITKNKQVIRNGFICLCTCLVLVNTFINFFKTMNEKYNGARVFSYSAGFMIYGSTARRIETLDRSQWLAAWAMVPGQGFCEKLFSKESCSYWSFQHSDMIGAKQRNQLSNQGLSYQAVEKELVHQSKNIILAHPLQYFTFYILELLKMFFWETTHIGFVFYPDWLERIYNINILNNLLRFLTAILTMLSVAYLPFNVLRKKHTLGELQRQENKDVSIISFLLLIIIGYSGFYALICILTRYCFPMVPLYLIAIGFSLNSFMLRQNANK